MAVRKPLVVVAGQVQELPAGDVTLLSAWPLMKPSVAVGETCDIPVGYQLIVAKKFSNSGTITNSGELYVI